ncbi:inactive rhomboid protein 1-like [Artemia franciscana]|uniref:inactive rhomboid protein 1-like n=1 Tax=Artemia franciscana TaxID=6661 RepID=UPI0032DB5DFD
MISKKSSMFLGVEKTTEVDQLNKWEERRRRYAERKGKLKMGDAGRRLGSMGDTVDSSILPASMPLLPEEFRKDSVTAMTWNGLVAVTELVKSRFRREEHAQVVTSGRKSRSIQQSSLQETKDQRFASASSREVFFDKPPLPPEPTVQDRLSIPVLEDAEESKKLVTNESIPQSSLRSKRDEVDSRSRRSRGRWSVVLDRVVDNSNRRQYGVGVVGRWFGGRTIRGSLQHHETVQQQLEAFEDYRPYFTYWVTTVQVVVLIAAIILYGFAPFGIGIRQRTGKVMVKSLSLETVDYYEPQNLWLGPRVAALIHLGAKFAPCMKSDTRIKQRLLDAREQEKSTACCIRNDNSGCIQATRSECSTLTSLWQKWTSIKTGPGGRISGSVCGQDPRLN